MTFQTAQFLLWSIAFLLLGILVVSSFGIFATTYYLAQIAREVRLTRILRD